MPENASCPLCNSIASDLFDRREFRGHTVINRICSTCGFVYQSPRMTHAELDAFYAAEYRQLYQGQEGPNPKDLVIQKARAAALSLWVARYVSHPTHHLDIGSSAGILLTQCRAKLHTQPAGIEPGKAYREYAQSQGLTMYATLDALPAGDRFDLVSMLHVLEHLPDPVDYLRNLRENVLTPDGWLLLEVPNLYIHDCFEVAHLISFSPHTLRQTVKQAGFRLIVLKAHGHPRSKLLPLYLTLLAQPAGGIPFRLQTETGVKTRCKWGFFYRRIATRLLPGWAWLPVA